MSGENFQQPDSFAFTPENQVEAEKIIAKYPDGFQASATMPLLDLAQRQHDNWVPQAAMDHIADMLEMPAIRVYEVATFYSMFNMKPIGKHHVQVCTNLPCMLRGSTSIFETCKRVLGVGDGQTTEDGLFTLQHVECLGACVNAPMIQIGDDFYEDLDETSTEEILSVLRAGGSPKPGPQN
ncbi:MAG: NADH-quinone oxidoreductase subunit NuoE, partial [Rhodospirillales bacterium]|nr:NADH-quinone oxidoreductase subunit NuoE [Rhodospirillales bacterium]